MVVLGSAGNRGLDRGGRWVIEKFGDLARWWSLVPRNHGGTTAQTRFESVSKHSNDSLLVKGNILQSDEDSLKLDELMALCTTLQNMVLDLEKTTTTQRNEVASLKRRVKKLEKKNRSRTHRLKRSYKVGLTARVESFGNEESLGEDASKQGRINAIDADEEITLVSVQDEVVSNDADKEMFDVDVLDGEQVFLAEHEVVVKRVNDEVNVVEQVVEVINIAKLIVDATQDSVAGDIVSTASAATVSAATTTTAIITTVGDITLAQALEEIKSKGILIEPMKPMKRKDQIKLDEEAALKLQAAFDEERLSREKAEKVEEANIALIETCDDIHAKIDADHEEEVAIDVIPLSFKSPKIVDWKIYKERRKSYYQIMRADGESQMYMVFSQMIKSFDNEDLEDLYKLVKAKYKSTRPVEDLDLLLWGDLKLMFEPHVEDEV
nr:hypothetical protein [Tanacetum cinerariifolium]